MEGWKNFFDIIEMNKYKEMEENDSFYVILKKQGREGNEKGFVDTGYLYENI